MKKLSFFILISFIFIGFMSAATITVTSPHSGDTWYKGSTHNITWTSTGIPASTNMKINIFKNSIDPANFVEQLKGPNSGTKSWTIAGSYVNGTYYIRVKTADSAVHGDSGSFTITAELTFRPPPVIGILATPSLRVTYPYSGETWYKGNTYNIRWNSSRIPASTNLKINIFKDQIDQEHYVPASQMRCENTLLHSWPIPSSYPDGTYYIRIKTEDNATHGDSEAFTIKERSLSVISPKTQEVWKMGEREEIKWEHVNISSGKIHLGLNRSYYRGPGTFVGFIAKSIPISPNSYAWEVGKFADGRIKCESGGYYFIWISTQDGSVNAYSNSSVQIRGINLVCKIRNAKCYDKKEIKNPFVLDTQGEYGSYLKFKIYANNNGVWPATSLNVKWRWRAYRLVYNSEARTLGPKTLIKTEEGRFLLSHSVGFVEKSIGPVDVAADNGDLLILEVEIDPDNEFNESELFRRSNKVEKSWVT